MGVLSSISNSFPQFYIPNFKITDLLEIIILIIACYKIITGIMNTRAGILLKGIAILLVFYFVCYILKFNAILFIFRGLITVAIFAIIIVFQPELRKLLENVGTKKVPIKQKINFFLKKQIPYKERYSDQTINELVDACFALSETKTGALIVLEKNVPLLEYSNTGILLEARTTKELLINIFEKNTPLHDGAVIIVGDTIISATAYLPLSQSKSINKKMGTRHRAAIGITETTDCQVLVVSEENGNVSYANNGAIKTATTKEQLTKWLKKEQHFEDKKEPMTFIERTKHNFGLKIFSCIFGLLFWIILMNIVDPIVYKTIDDIPITVANEDVIISTGKIYEIISDKEVSVNISGKRSEIDKIDKQDLTVIGDLSKMSYVYAVPLTAYSLTYPDINCTVENNTMMTVQISDKVDKEFTLDVETVGNNDKYFVTDFKLSSDKIIVSGTKELISIIGNVKLLLPIANITENGDITLSPIIYDKNGSILTDKMLSFDTEEITINYKIYPKKTIPINVTTNSNTLVKEITQDFKEVSVAGTETALKSINSIDINLDLKNILGSQSSELSKTIDLNEYIPQNIFIADNHNELIVTLFFTDNYEKSINIQKSDIEIRNLSSDLKVIFEDITDTLRISGEKEKVDNITISMIKPYLDFSSLSTGEYNLTLQYNNTDGIKIINSPLIKLKIVEVDK